MLSIYIYSSHKAIEVPPQAGRIVSHPQVSNPSLYIGDENSDPPDRHPLAHVETQAVARGPSAPGEDGFPYPGQMLFHTSSTPTTWERKR